MKDVRTVASIGEFEMIRACFAPKKGSEGRGVILGIGDDAAVLSVPRTQELLVTTDTLVEGIHFSSDADPYLLGQRSLRVNLSDIAAMGGEPRWYQLALSLPEATPLAWVEEFSRGLREAEALFNVVLVGGNTTGCRGGITVTITLLGLIGQDRSLRRSGARVGDRILVSGTIGDAALGLAQMLGRLTVAGEDDLIFLRDRHQLPTPRVGLGLVLQESAVARSAIDVSDGLVADLEKLCKASGVGAELSVERVPLSAAAKRQVAAHGADLLSLILTGGEDYELIFSASEGAMGLISAFVDKTGVFITDIGVITATGSVVVTQDGHPLHLESGGWCHF